MKIDGQEIEVHVPPSELWGFFNCNKARLENKMVCIASNPSTGVEIYLTEEYAMPSILVYENDEQLYKEPCSSQKDSEYTLKDIYNRFLFPKKINDKDKTSDAFDADGIEITDEDREMEEELTRMEREDTISEREAELDMAFEDFMTVVLNEDTFLLDEISFAEELYGMMDEILVLIASHGCPVYRPTFVIDNETGSEIYMEYPYEDLEDADPAISAGISSK